MKKSASFTINHDKLKKGMYISRIDGDVVTYDIRMKLPNNKENDYLSSPAMHTFEHLFATYARNTEFKDNIIYIGPMGCRTGFYLLTKDLSHSEVIRLVKKAMKFVCEFEGNIPGSTKAECGNYLDHDLQGAKQIAIDMIEVLKNWNKEKLYYEYHS